MCVYVCACVCCVLCVLCACVLCVYILCVCVYVCVLSVFVLCVCFMCALCVRFVCVCVCASHTQTLAHTHTYEPFKRRKTQFKSTYVRCCITLPIQVNTNRVTVAITAITNLSNRKYGSTVIILPLWFLRVLRTKADVKTCNCIDGHGSMIDTVAHFLFQLHIKS